MAVPNALGDSALRPVLPAVPSAAIMDGCEPHAVLLTWPGSCAVGAVFRSSSETSGQNSDLSRTQHWRPVHPRPSLCCLLTGLPWPLPPPRTLAPGVSSLAAVVAFCWFMCADISIPCFGNRVSVTALWPST